MKKNYKEIFERMVSNTLQYIEKYGLKSMVLGISGGIDSTVVAFVCHEISKRTDHKVKFIGVSLPSKTNADEENCIALGIGKLCDKFIVHSIQEDFENLSSSFDYSSYLNGIDAMKPLQLGNIKARIRMMYIYNLASLTGGITMDTDNKTEHLQGFFTIHGDVFDLNCGLSNLYKHEVYELAEWIHSNYEMEEPVRNFLRSSIDIVPTDGNGVLVGGDLAQIAPGMTYEQVDEVLSSMDDEKALEELRLVKYPAHLVDGIIHRYNRTCFKRESLPIVLDVVH